ncbi:uncharacterized protein L3040_005445 [Drepanopeziza brunnea f. sp. 'multigermtubi']|uniref:uncharacterized protein n=1 Tax=Drepanopeziza brunnea f. sp. 'multigermtubi' TaxID=698441 RepID=UPI002393642E|nr:hypothetical protein L3040_005445 [Drepanopeziza brunnea f. sp. 'multigermtubi']
MGAIRNVAILVLVISFFTFVAFFGRLPALRNTPIGALHRLIWLHIPATLRAWDQRVTQGRLSAWVMRQAHILWNDRHPIVMIFFILLLLVSEIMFLPPAWHMLSGSRKITGLILLSLPYIFLYTSAARDPGYIGQLAQSTAAFNHFLLLLFTTGVLTAYATYVGFSILSDEARKEIPSWTFRGQGLTWFQFWYVWAWVLQEYTRIGAVTLLCLLTTPLIFGLLGYHVYLIWAGTTTNESMKWSDWEAEMADGFAFKCLLPADREKDERIEPAWTRWPVESQQLVSRTADGQPPRGPGGIGAGEWERVWRLADVENLYDLGFWDNLADVFFPTKWFRARNEDNTRETGSRSFSAAETDALVQQQIRLGATA